MTADALDVLEMVSLLLGLLRVVRAPDVTSSSRTCCCAATRRPHTTRPPQAPAPRSGSAVRAGRSPIPARLATTPRHRGTSDGHPLASAGLEAVLALAVRDLLTVHTLAFRTLCVLFFITPWPAKEGVHPAAITARSVASSD